MPEKTEFLIFRTKTNAVVPYPTRYNKFKPAYSLHQANNAMRLCNIWSTILNEYGVLHVSDKVYKKIIKQYSSGQCHTSLSI